MTDDETNGPTDHELAELIRAERHRAQIDERRRRNGLRRQADESVSLLDVLGALAAHGTQVTVHTKAGAQLAATICDLGRDYVALRSPGSLVRLIPTGEIVEARAIGAVAGARSAIRAEPRLELGERLRELADRRSVIRLTTRLGVVTGRLRRVGLDVLVVEQDDATDTFVALDALVEVVVGH